MLLPDHYKKIAIGTPDMTINTRHFGNNLRIQCKGATMGETLMIHGTWKWSSPRNKRCLRWVGWVAFSLEISSTSVFCSSSKNSQEYDLYNGIRCPVLALFVLTLPIRVIISYKCNYKWFSKSFFNRTLPGICNMAFE